MQKFKEENIYYKIALFIGGVVGLFWCALIFNEIIAVKNINYGLVVQLLLIGGTILLTVGIACRQKLVGGVLLLCEAIISLLLIFIASLNYFPTVIILCLLTLPIFIAGGLFVISKLVNKKKPLKKKARKNNKSKK